MNKITIFVSTICFSLITGINPLFSQDEDTSSSWKHEMQSILGVEQTGKADRELYDALYVFLLAKGIDEPEELDFEPFILHGPVHELVGPEGGRHDSSACLTGIREEFISDL